MDIPETLKAIGEFIRTAGIAGILLFIIVMLLKERRGRREVGGEKKDGDGQKTKTYANNGAGEIHRTLDRLATVAENQTQMIGQLHTTSELIHQSQLAMHSRFDSSKNDLRDGEARIIKTIEDINK